MRKVLAFLFAFIIGISFPLYASSVSSDEHSGGSTSFAGKYTYDGTADNDGFRACYEDGQLIGYIKDKKVEEAKNTKLGSSPIVLYGENKDTAIGYGIMDNTGEMKSHRLYTPFESDVYESVANIKNLPDYLFKTGEDPFKGQTNPNLKKSDGQYHLSWYSKFYNGKDHEGYYPKNDSSEDYVIDDAYIDAYGRICYHVKAGTTYEQMYWDEDVKAYSWRTIAVPDSDDFTGYRTVSAGIDTSIGGSWYAHLEVTVSTNFPFWVNAKTDSNGLNTFNTNISNPTNKNFFNYTGYGINGTYQYNNDGTVKKDENGNPIYDQQPLSPDDDINNPQSEKHFDKDNPYNNPFEKNLSYYDKNIGSVLKLIAQLVQKMPDALCDKYFKIDENALQNFIDGCQNDLNSKENNVLIYSFSLLDRFLNGFGEVAEGQMSISFGPIDFMGVHLLDQQTFDYKSIVGEGKVKEFHEYYLKMMDFFVTVGFLLGVKRRYFKE